MVDVHSDRELRLPGQTMSGRLLVAYSNSSNYVSTTQEYLQSISRYSRFEVRYVHATNQALLDFDLNEFDAVFQSYCVRLPFDGHVSDDYIRKMKTFRGVKMLAVQDEYDLTDKLKAAIREIGYHVHFTNVPPAMVDRIYPPDEFAQTEFITVLTGYVPENLEDHGRTVRPLAERPIHIGYRGRKLDAYYGRLGFEKFEIGRRMREICLARGIPHDIEWGEDKRLYGEAWYDFIGSCRANLGSETGSNVFDFDGSIRAAYQELAAARGEPVPHQEFRRWTDPVEAQFDVGQISPRIFEAAAMRTPLILFSGRYMGLIEPDEHYLELKKDFSNVDAVLCRLDDLEALEAMAARTYDRLVASGDFSYRRLVGLIDETARRKAQELGIGLRPPTGERDRTQPMLDVASLADLRERPTTEPRDHVLFRCRQLARDVLTFSREVDHLNTVYPAEFARLNRVLAEETARLHAVCGATAARMLGLVLLRGLARGIAARLTRLLGPRFGRQLTRLRQSTFRSSGDL